MERTNIAANTRRALCSVLMLIFFAPPMSAQRQDLSELSIEDLMNITVTTAGKKEQKLEDTAAAAYIITQEDIRRSGMTSVPELLRMVPGVSVAQIDANTWAITARGFTGRFANRLLVLLDGRSVYTPTYSGVYWDAQDLLLEDVDRIEVIRGPGATMWGANAVNGVINIITKTAKETQGVLLTSGISLADQRFAALRYGSGLGREGSFRVYGKYFKRDGLVYADGSGSPDGWDMARGGFRADYRLSTRDNLTVQGDAYNGALGQRSLLFAVNPVVTSVNEELAVGGGNLLGRWTRAASPRSEFSLQAYLDATQRNELLLGQRVTTADLQFQHHLLSGERHDIVWGAGFRHTSALIRNSPWLQFAPVGDVTNIISAFAQDEISFWKSRLRVTFGSKFEHNEYTGFEIQPNIRMFFRIKPHHHVWAAVSRAIRTPSEAERDVQSNIASGLLPNGQVLLAKMFGSRELESENLLAYEAGYRWQATSRLSFDLAGFYNVFDDATSAQLGQIEVEMSPSPPHLLLPVVINNANAQRSFGAEGSVNLNLASWWKLSAAEAWQQMRQINVVGVSGDSLGRQFSLETPHQMFNVRSTFLLPRNVEFDVGSYYVSRLLEQQVPSYVRLDMRLGWRPSPQLELSFGGHNLLQDQHTEYGPVLGLLPTAVRRNAYARATWRF